MGEGCRSAPREGLCRADVYPDPEQKKAPDSCLLGASVCPQPVPLLSALNIHVSGPQPGRARARARVTKPEAGGDAVCAPVERRGSTAVQDTGRAGRGMPGPPRAGPWMLGEAAGTVSAGW